MAALGTRDGRDDPAFDKLYEEGRLGRLKDGRYTLNGGRSVNGPLTSR